MKKRILAAIIVAVMACSMSGLQQVAASAISNANKTKEEAQGKLDDVNNSISDIETKQEKLQSEINALDAQLVDLLVQMDVLAGELEAKDEQLAQVKSDLKQAKQDEADQYDSMSKRIQFMYETGDSSLLTAILESKSLAEVLNRVRYYASVYDYDRDQLTRMQETKQQIKGLKVQVEAEKAEMEEMQAAYEQQESELNTMVAQKSNQVSEFGTQLASAKDLAAKYKATIEEQNEIIKREEEKQAAAEEAARKEEAARRAAAAAVVAANQNTGSSSSGNGSSTGSGSSSSGSSSSGNGSSTGSSSSSSGSSSSDSGSSAAPADTSKNPSYKTGVSGSDVVAYACQFVGNPYVWGGTDPNTGADCSGFTQYVMAHFGISIPRTSTAQRSCGQEVSYANAKAGDLICYSGHVAIYMGGGQIVHAQSTAVGITTGSATYRTILSVRRVL